MQNITSISNKLKNKDGFTLVELMIVVSIIGILAAIAIPNYQKYQARARQSEAKITLAGIYTAESSFAADQSTYSGCLSSIGFTQQGGGKIYYASGFLTVPTTGCGPGGSYSCVNYNYNVATPAACPGTNTGYYYFAANTGANGLINNATTPVLPAASMTTSTFTAGAAGYIDSSPSISPDQWSIDNNNNLFNSTPNL